MHNLYARFVLWLIGPALDRHERGRAQRSARINVAVLNAAVKAVAEASRRGTL
ncbi:hypothetical protein D3C86_1169510 [compost metagenome]